MKSLQPWFWPLQDRFLPDSEIGKDSESEYSYKSKGSRLWSNWSISWVSIGVKDPSGPNIFTGNWKQYLKPGEPEPQEKSWM